MFGVCVYIYIYIYISGVKISALTLIKKLS